jgi:hypothetical protein
MDSLICQQLFKILPKQDCYICYNPIDNANEICAPSCCNSFYHYDCINLHQNTSGAKADCPGCGNSKLLLADDPFDKFIYDPTINGKLFIELLSNYEAKARTLDHSLRTELGVNKYCQLVKGYWPLFDISITYKNSASNPLYGLEDPILTNTDCFNKRLEEFTYGIFNNKFLWKNIRLTGTSLTAISCSKSYRFVSHYDAIQMVVYHKNPGSLKNKTHYLINFIVSRLPESTPFLSFKDGIIHLLMKGIARPILIEPIFTDNLFTALTTGKKSYITLNQLGYSGTDGLVGTLKAVMSLKRQECYSAANISSEDNLLLERFGFHLKNADDDDNDVERIDKYLSELMFEIEGSEEEIIADYSETADSLSEKMGSAVTSDIDKFIDSVFNTYYLVITINTKISPCGKMLLKDVVDKIDYIDMITKKDAIDRDMQFKLVSTDEQREIIYGGIIADKPLRKFVLKHIYSLNQF